MLGHWEPAPFHQVGWEEDSSCLPCLLMTSAPVCKHLRYPQGAVLLSSASQSFLGSCLWSSRHHSCFFPRVVHCAASLSPQGRQPQCSSGKSGLFGSPRFFCVPLTFPVHCANAATLDVVGDVQSVLPAAAQQHSNAGPRQGQRMTSVDFGKAPGACSDATRASEGARSSTC